MPHLRLPASVITTELVHEDDRRPDAGFLIEQAHAVVGRCETHGYGSPLQRLLSELLSAGQRRLRRDRGNEISEAVAEQVHMVAHQAMGRLAVAASDGRQ